MCDPMTALTLGGSVIQGIGQQKASKAKVDAANQNAAQLATMAQREKEKAEFEVVASEEDFRRAIGQTRAAIGASGLTSGSFSDIIADAATGHSLDKQAIRYGGATRAEQLMFQAESERMEAEAAGEAGTYNMVGTALGAAGSFVKMRPAQPSAGVSITTPFATP